MPKKSKKAVDAIEQLVQESHCAESLDEDNRLRLVRRLSSQLRRTSDELKHEKAARAQAEEELVDLADFEQLVHATQDNVKIRRYSEAKKRTGGKATAIFCATDWHAEENVDPATVNGLNEYNLTIARERIQRTFQKFVRLLEFSRGMCNIKDAVLWLGGDLINGYIHEELQEANFLGPADAILWAQSEVAAGLQYLLDNTDLTFVVTGSIGNHGRTTHRTRSATAAQNSWEWVAYNNLAWHFKSEPRVSWQLDRSYHNLIDVQGHPIRFHHGDAIRYQGGVGGITIPVNKAIAQWNKAKVARFDIFGHWHQFLTTWNFVSVGCLVGHNAYAIRIKADYQRPTQGFVVIDREHGPIMSLPVFC